MRTLRALQIIHPGWTRKQCMTSLRLRQREIYTWPIERRYIKQAAITILKRRSLGANCDMLARAINSVAVTSMDASVAMYAVIKELSVTKPKEEDNE